MMRLIENIVIITAMIVGALCLIVGIVELATH